MFCNLLHLSNRKKRKQALQECKLSGIFRLTAIIPRVVICDYLFNLIISVIYALKTHYYFSRFPIFRWSSTNMIMNSAQNYMRKFCFLMIFLFSNLCALNSGPVPKEVNPNVEIVEDENIEHLSLTDGLSQGTVKCIFQDSKGFLWFGTLNGLNRYDGYGFKIFTNNPENPATISDNNINNIAEDVQGNLWIGTSNGLNKYDSKTETFENFFFDDKTVQNLTQKSLSDSKLFNVLNFNNSSVMEICYNKKLKSDVIWLGVINGLVEFNIYSKKFKIYKPSFFGNDPYLITYITDNGKGDLIISYNYDSKGYVLKFNKKTKEFSFINEINSIFKHDKTENVNKMFIDSREFLWIATNLRILCYNLSTKLFMREYFDFIPENSLISGIFEDNESNMWFTTVGLGLWKADIKKKILYKRLNDPTSNGSISYNALLCGYFDNNNNIWIGSNGLGIDKFNNFSNRFNLVKGGSKNCTIKSIRVFFEDNNGNIWISGYNGLLLYKSHINKLYNLTKNNSEFFFRPKKFTNKKLLNELKLKSDNLGLNYKYPEFLVGTVYTFTNDNYKNDVIWMGFEGNGLYKVYVNDMIYEKIPMDQGEKSIIGGYVFSLLSDSKGNIWCGTERGLNKFTPSKNEYVFYCNNQNNNSISPGNVKVIYSDKKGVIWAGTDIGGLNRYDSKSGTFIRYTFNKGQNCISSNSVLSIYEDRKQRFWIGTNNGLNFMDRESGKFISYTVEDGLPNNTIYGILEDEKGCLWLSTNRGLSRFNPEMKNFYNFSYKDGLQSDEFNTGAYLKTRSGELFFGGVNGFNHFFPSQIFSTTTNSNIVLTDFSIFNKYVKIGEKINNRVLLTQSITETDEIVLNYNENMITLEYALLSYCNPGKIKYKYRLQNFNDKWILTNDRKVTFTNLNPGEYVFSVIGSSNESVWNEKGATVRIIILPPFWQTWWFRSLVAFLVITMIYLLYRLRIRDIRRRQIELEKIVVERTKDLINEKEKTEQLYNKSEQLLLNVLPAPIAQRLKDGETLIADHFESASVVFIDIVDFTTLSAHSKPQDTVRMLNEIFSIFDKISAKFGLEKIKTIGDCYMAAAGVPLPRTDHAEAISLMALEVLETMEKYAYSNDGSQSSVESKKIQFRVGLDCGPTVAGVIGEQKFIYDLWGDMVNTASRMETNGVIGRIQCTERFKEQLEISREDLGISFEERGMVDIKGKGQMMTYLLKNQISRF